MTCPLCFHCQQTELHPPSDSVSLIEKELKRLGQVVSQLNDSRIALLRRLNSIRSATRNLPSEVLSLVFVCAAPPVDIASRSLRLYRKETYPDLPENYDAILLQRVCAQWFHVVRSTPQLWSSLILDVPDVKHVQPRISILQTYLENAKNFSFSLELNFNKDNLPINAVDSLSDGPAKDYDPEGYALLIPFYSIIFATPGNSHRFKILRLSEMPPAWRALPFGSFSRLEEFRLGGEHSVIDSVPTSRVFRDFQTPNLKRIIAKNTYMPLSPESVPFIQTVTIVNLCGVPINNCFQILVLFPSLIEFRARDSRFLDDYDAPDMSKDFTKPQLEVLEWTCSNSMWNTAFLEHVHLPTLRTLCWGGDQNRVNGDILTAFFQRLPPSLVEMEVVQVEDDPINLEYRWDEHWMLLTHVQKLSLRQCSFWGTSRVLESLGDEHILPALREIYLIEPPYSKSKKMGGFRDYQKEDQDDEEWVRTELFRMVKSRGPEKKFRFVTMDRDLSWKPIEDGKKLRNLLRRGFDLEFFEDNSLLLCLYDDYNDESSSREESSEASESSDTNSEEDDGSTSTTNDGLSGEDESGDEYDLEGDTEESSSS